jgi:acyl-CoA dehydrogenase
MLGVTSASHAVFRIAYQADHRLYATVLSPRQHSTLGYEFDLLRYARFLEVFGYFSPAHGYSLQVSFLGLFAILMGTNDALKREAVAALEAGGLLAFGVSEKHHGSDLLASEFTVRPSGPDRLIASGSKYYIGNANAASIIAILAKKEDAARAAGPPKRAPFVLIALRPNQCKGFGNLRKIRTLGVRAGFVGEFEVKDHELPQSDVITDGRGAWDAVLGTVTLGKFFLGFGSIGICERALQESVDHLNTRILYGKPVIEMPHIRAMAVQTYARLAAMKLYAYRALDYVHAASANDRRYLLYCAVQKAKVSTEGVKVMSLLSECIGAKGFESDTFFEMALRDIQLIPGLEGSTHINLGLAAQFIPRYFAQPTADLVAPSSRTKSGVGGENPYLMNARTGALNTIGFPHLQSAFEPLSRIPNVQLFIEQVNAFRLFLNASGIDRPAAADARVSLSLGQCFATIAYAQLIAENSVLLAVPPPVVAVIFHLLIGDLSVSALSLAAIPAFGEFRALLTERMVSVQHTSDADWDRVWDLQRQESGTHATTE